MIERNKFMRKTEHKEKTTLYAPKRIKRRIKLLADDENVKMNDIILRAVQEYLDRKDAAYSSPDYVLERLNEVLNSQIELVQAVNKQTEISKQLLEKLDEGDR